MPSSNDPNRQKDKNGRQQALLQKAKTTSGEVQNWTQYFTQKFTGGVTTTVGSTVGTHVSLYAFAKVTLAVAGLVLPAAGIGSLIAGTLWGMKDVLLEYGAATIEDLIKEGGTQVTTGVIGYMGSTPETTLTEKTNKKKSSIETVSKELCEAMGALAALIQQSEKLQNSACSYCDDAYARARVIERAGDELVKVKTKISELTDKLNSLKQIVNGQLTQDLGTRKNDVKNQALATVAKAGAPHFQDNWGSYLSVNTIDPTYRLRHCSQAHCYGPGPNGRD
jgi:hypothetical protein